MTIQLREYQADAIAAMYSHLLEKEGNPLIVIPTGGGKTPMIATIAHDVVDRWSGRVGIITHVKELVSHAAASIKNVAPQLPMGIYHAGLRRRDRNYACMVMGIHSVWKKACDLGRFDMLLVDEAHMIPFDGDGMYQTFITEARAVNPKLVIAGLTATPFRLGGGMIAAPGRLFSEICYEISVADLITQGYLSPLRSRNGANVADLSKVAVRGGEFVAGEAEKAMDDAGLVEEAVAEIIELTKARRSVLIFAQGVAHCEHVVEAFKRRGHECGMVTGGTLDLVRDNLIERFKEGSLKYLANVNVLTTGFDAPGTDCVVLLRATMSPGLYYQMVGRGFRLAPGKTDCLVLDYGGNVMRHGPVDAIEYREPNKRGGPPPTKECPTCHELIALSKLECHVCGHRFPEPEWKPPHEAKAAATPVLSTEVIIEKHPVRKAVASKHYNRKDATKPPTMRIDYEIGYNWFKPEFICIEHEGYARSKAESWWRLRSHLPCPTSIDDAVRMVNAGEIAQTKAITLRTRPGEKWPEIVAYELGEKPVLEPGALDEVEQPATNTPKGYWDSSIDEDDLPF